jgi:hypothetical protein
MPSMRYDSMVEQIARLAKALLPRELSRSSTKHFTNRSVRALSFRILCHAESVFEKGIPEATLA